MKKPKHKTDKAKAAGQTQKRGIIIVTNTAEFLEALKTLRPPKSLRPKKKKKKKNKTK